MPLSKSVTPSQQPLGRPRKTHQELYTEAKLGRSVMQDVLRIDTAPIVDRKLPTQSPPDSRTSAPLEASMPVKPSEIRRADSLNRGALSPMVNGATPLRRFASTSDRTTSSHSRHTSMSRSPLSSAEPVSESPTNGDASPLRKKPARRDSIVLERARHWGAPGSQAPAPQTQSTQLTLEDLSAFPMPPMPPLPTKSKLDLNRPIAKLDRSKLPFH